MNSSSVRKLCAGCGADVSQSKYTKETDCAYIFCEMCSELRMEALRTERNDSIRIAGSPVRPVGAHTARERWSLAEKSILTVGLLAGVGIVWCLIYVLFIRDSWENQNRENLIALKTDAEALVQQGNLDEGKSKYEALFQEMGDHKIRDATLQQELDVARSSLAELPQQITSARKRKQAADRQRHDQEDRQHDAYRLAQERAERERQEAASRQLAQESAQLEHEQQDRLMQKQRQEFWLAQKRQQAEDLYQLGKKYMSGVGMPQDIGKALDTFRSAADLGNTAAMRTIGHMYVNGQGVESNAAMAVVWFKKAADLGDGDAMAVLGTCYAEGDGVAVDETKAVELFRSSANLNNGTGICMLAGAYLQGSGVSKDAQEAKRQYLKGAELNNAASMYMLGVLFAEGKDFPKDEPGAFAWYQKAAGVGHIESICCVGDCYYRGVGVNADAGEAFKWYLQAAGLGHPRATFNVGIALAKGDGINVNQTLALQWLRKADELGDTNAKGAIKRVEHVQHEERRKTRLAELDALLKDARGRIRTLESQERDDLGDAMRAMMRESAVLPTLNADQLDAWAVADQKRIEDDQQAKAQAATVPEARAGASAFIVCPRCHGTGRRLPEEIQQLASAAAGQMISGFQKIDTTCPECHGKGKVPVRN